MSLISDALKKAQAQTALRSKGLRVDLTGAGGDAPRTLAPMLAALAVAGTVGVGTILVVAYLLYVNQPAGGDGPFAGDRVVDMSRPETSDPSSPPILSVQPHQGEGNEPDAEPAEASDTPAAPPAAAERDAGAGRSGRDDASEPEFQAVLEPTDMDLAEGMEPTAPERAADPAPESAEPRPPLEEGGEYVEVLDVADLPKLELTGIAWSDFAKIALVNGMSLEPGDLIQGIRVKEVEPERVHFRAPGGKTFYMRMR